MHDALRRRCACALRTVKFLLELIGLCLRSGKHVIDTRAISLLVWRQLHIWFDRLKEIGFRFPTKIQLEYGSQWFEIKGSSNIINLVRSFLYIFTFSFTIFFKQKGTAGREHQGIIRIEDWTRDCGLPVQVT